MNKLIILWWLISSVFVYAVQNIVPLQEIVVDGVAKDLIVYKTTVIIGTDRGKLQVYDFQEKKFVKEIVLPMIEDFTEEAVAPRVYSVDFEDNRYLLLSESGKGGFSNLWIHENNISTQLIFPKDKKTLVKARFVDKDHILLGYLSNEAALFKIDTRQELYRIQLSESKFSDFTMDETKNTAAYGCESGVITLIDIQKGSVLKELKGINLDNTYKLDFKNGIISAAGQDRRGGFYEVETGKGDYIEGSFLIYATGLSPSAKRVAFALDEQNTISVFERKSKTKIASLIGQKSTLNAIVFKDEELLFSASDDNTVLMWKLN